MTVNTRFEKRMTLVKIKDNLSNDEKDFEFQGHMKENSVKEAILKIVPYSFEILSINQVIRTYVTDSFTLENEQLKKQII